MVDDTTKRGKADRTRVNVHQNHELRYWTEKFGVTPERLKEAVAKVGTSVEAVQRELGQS
jgi:hypothetical protein